MDKSFESYVKECWKKAVDICSDKDNINCTDNAVVIAVFDKICSHYHYWRER